MTIEDVLKIARILLTADGGRCPSCAGALFQQFFAAFPESEEFLDLVWKESDMPKIGHWGERGWREL